ncbi:methionyl-tRNA formyltransferase [Entomobacter blattae]|uniref:Methionyl-tRNA formyltransferase n=1 Tax=Entomobacter blattae TaxID=2762277 RepID=A0A7H1NSM9_9PROT|nr:methionyl-tRNA formyltransferase [Entomobacter blattae]QNT78789.1 Methionyl-tRNA formyltransferase [Entomobacter blattae]
MAKLKIVYMGTPDFAVPALKTLHEKGHIIACVYTQPPRKAGRGYKVIPSAVQSYAEKLSLPIRSPLKLKNNLEEQVHLLALKPDVIVVAAYGLILPKEVLNIPPKGCLNIHASLLPRWRGASPIQSSILAGDQESGVSIMKMEEGLDTGPVFLQDQVAITPTTTAQTLHDTLSELGASLLLQVLQIWPTPTPQPDDGVIYAPRLTKQDGAIHWAHPAEQIDRQVRAFTPWPGTYTHYKGEVLKISRVKPVPLPHGMTAHTPGTIIDESLTIYCGEHTALQIESLQRPGGKMLPTAQFLLGYPLPIHSILGQ